MTETKSDSPEVRLKPNTYQSSKAELDAELRIKSSFHKAVNSLVTPIEVKRDLR